MLLLVSYYTLFVNIADQQTLDYNKLCIRYDYNKFYIRYVCILRKIL